MKTLIRFCFACGLILVLIVLLVHGIDTTDNSGSSDRPEKPKAGGERSAGLESAKRTIAPLLLAPASAKWPWESITSAPLHQGAQYRAWTVTGIVDAQNAAGVLIRHHWEVIVVLSVEKDTLFPVRTTLDGEIVWGSTQAVNELLATK